MLPDSLALEDESLEDRIEAFLAAQPEDEEEMPDADSTFALAEALDEARIDANGGSREARAALNAVRDRIDRAARRDEINLGILILLGRVFAGSQLDIGEAARASMGRMLSAGVFRRSSEEAYRAFVEPQLSFHEGDAFALHGELRMSLAIFPADFRAELVAALAIDANPRGRGAAVGFLLDSEEPAALAAARGLAAAEALGAVDAECRGRIDMVRDWLSPSRRAALDAVARSTAPASGRPAGQLVRTIASICDGSGAAALLATLKKGTRYSIAAVLTKPYGVAEAFIVEDLSKSDAAALELRYKTSTPASEVPLAAWMRLVGLGLGRNLQRGAPPPFGLARALEAIGLASLAPDPATPGEIIATALAGDANAEASSAASRAHRSVAESDVAYSWFEAEEAVDGVLKSTDSIMEGTQTLIESYLPGRRGFWALQCALSALALKESEAKRGASWKDLALVGRDLARDTPISEIPLMRRIAERSATAYFMHSGRAAPF